MVLPLLPVVEEPWYKPSVAALRSRRATEGRQKNRSESVAERDAITKIIRDCFGCNVRFSDGRLAHILQHVELVGMESEI